MLSVLHIKLLGDFGLAYGDEPITRVDTARLQALLAYLVLHAATPQQRQYLAFRFWPDSIEKQARTNLRQLLHNLRRALPRVDHFIEASTQTLQWRPDAPFTLDVAEFEQALIRAERADGRGAPEARRQSLEEAVRLYTGDLLPGCYDEWIEPEREHLRQQYIAALDRLVRLLEQQRAYQKAIPYARRLLQAEPLRETTYRTLMRLHALQSDRASALRVYHRCATVLEEELGVEPDPATRQLHERLLNMQAPPAEEQPAPRLPGSVAALPLVGRQLEWGRLRAAWRTATREQPHFALIAGEAGVGKTRLAEELLTWVARQGGIAARTRCYAAEGRLAFAPITDWLRAEAFQTRLPKLDAVWRAEVARILPELLAKAPDLPRAEPLTESWQRRRFFEALARAVLAAPPPMVLLIDDLQWCDRDTLEWLHFLLRFDPGAQMLLLGTVRVEEVEAAHPLEALLLDLRRSGQVTEIPLGPLDAAETASLAEHVAARALGANQAAHLYRETEGNPLFVVESVRAGRVATNDHLKTLPPKMHAILTARLAQCSLPAREVAHLAAVVGRAFTFAVLAEASDLDADTLVRSLDELWQRRIVGEHGSDAYDFRHDKLREVAYAEASPMQRRRLHHRVAEAIETIYAANLDAVTSQLAAHYERAGLPERAIPYYQQAAQVAQRISAHEEAITLLNRALALLKVLPQDPQRDARERSLLSDLGPSLFAARGYAAAEAGRAYTRAYALRDQEKNPRRIFSVLFGLCAHHVVRAELRKVNALCEQLLLLARDRNDPALLVPAHFETGVSLGHLGEFVSARAHLEQALDHYAPEQHQDFCTFLIGSDPGVFSLSYLPHILWHLGYPAQALKRSGEALALADELAHPFSRAIALSYLTMLHQFRREPQAVLELAEATMALCTEHGFPYYRAWGAIMQGWALHRLGQQEEGQSRMQQGLADLRATGARLREPYYLSLLAEACSGAARVEEGLTILEEARATARRTDECWPMAELHRLRGALLLREDADEAEASFRQALDLARRQHAQSLALRAAVSLSSLWQAQGRQEEARTLLKQHYDGFTEGFDTPDLKEAAALLEVLV